MKHIVAMTPQKRAQYAEWLRNSGVEHPSDELIDKTRKRALLQIDNAKEKAQRYKLTLVALIICSLVLAICVWFRI